MTKVFRNALGVFVAMALLCAASAATAHATRPALFEVRQTESGWLGRWTNSSSSSLIASPPSGCTAVSHSNRHTGGRTVSTWELDCPQGPWGSKIGVTGLETEPRTVMLKVHALDGYAFGALLDARNPSVTIRTRPSAPGAAGAYVAAGARHVLSGADHVLFVFCLLVLLFGRWRGLLTVITAFTVGHSITLALAMADVLRVASAPTEALIALTLVWPAAAAARPVLAPAHQTATIAGAFGLLHGLGFAGGLQELGLPSTQAVWALLGFNVGVELGQLLVVAAGAILLGVAARGTTLPPNLRRALAYPLGCAGALWFFERLALL